VPSLKMKVEKPKMAAKDKTNFIGSSFGVISQFDKNKYASKQEAKEAIEKQNITEKVDDELKLNAVTSTLAKIHGP